jgi:ABC-2 type transport system ATP-binding protein
MSETPLLEVEGLTVGYGGAPIVRGIDLGTATGRMNCIVGPNGAGKTTTIKMLTTLLHPTSGLLTLNGLDPTKNSHAARQSFGIVFQDPSLDDELTAYENMFFHAGLYGVPRAETPKKIEDLLKFIELWDRRDSLVKTFSGGMKRRLEIARGLLHTPAILFLDEPTIGLDVVAAASLREFLREFNTKNQATIILTSHNMDDIEKLCSRVIIIKTGEMIYDGSPKGLMSISLQ